MICCWQVASRVAEERGSILGAEVGYTIRFEDCSEEKITKVKVGQATQTWKVNEKIANGKFSV